MAEVSHVEALAQLERALSLGRSARTVIRHLDALAGQLAEQLAERRAAIDGCSICSTLPHHCHVTSTSVDPASLPPAAHRLMPQKGLHASRCVVTLRCHECDTPYRYERDYEFLMITEDDEDLLRLDVGEIIEIMRRHLRARGQLGAARALLPTLTEALRLARGAELRTRLRAALGRAQANHRDARATLLRLGAPLTKQLAATIAACPICAQIRDREDPPSKAAWAIMGQWGPQDLPKRCYRCGTAYRHEYNADIEDCLIRLNWQTMAKQLFGPEHERTIERMHAALDVWQGDEIWQPQPYGDARLHEDVAHDLERRLYASLAYGADPNERDAYEWTPLMRAAVDGKLPFMRELLAFGAEIDARNMVGETALFLAAESGQAKAVALLLREGADPLIPCAGSNAKSRSRGLRGVAKKGTTPAQVARKHGHEAIARRLERAAP